MGAKDELLHVIRTTSSGTIAILTGESKYSVIDQISDRAVSNVMHMSERKVSSLTDDGRHFGMPVLARIFKTAQEEVSREG